MAEGWTIGKSLCSNFRSLCLFHLFSGFFIVVIVFFGLVGMLRIEFVASKEIICSESTCFHSGVF